MVRTPKISSYVLDEALRVPDGHARPGYRHSSGPLFPYEEENRLEYNLNSAGVPEIPAVPLPHVIPVGLSRLPTVHNDAQGQVMTVVRTRETRERSSVVHVQGPNAFDDVPVLWEPVVCSGLAGTVMNGWLVEPSLMGWCLSSPHPVRVMVGTN